MIFELNRNLQKIVMHKDACPLVASKLKHVNLDDYENGFAASRNTLYFSDKYFDPSKASVFFNCDFDKIFCNRCF